MKSARRFSAISTRLLVVCTLALLAAPAALADGERNLRLTIPRRMIADRSQTVKAEIVDSLGRIDPSGCPVWGQVSARRVIDGADVPLTVTNFDPHQADTDNGIRLFFGRGSVSFTLDGGGSLPSQEIEVTVTVGDLSASKKVSVLASPSFRQMVGTLVGPSLSWGPDETIRVTGNVTVPYGETLVIQPGTLVMVDTTGPTDNGTLITVDGEIRALGTADRPIHFFSEMGAAAMFLTQSGGPSNPNAWQGIHHRNEGLAIYRHVFLTGAGNGDPVAHPRPPVLRFEHGTELQMESGVLVDNCGLVISGPDGGTFTIRDTLLQRTGIGAEFGNFSNILVEDTWFTSGGWGPAAFSLDGDGLNLHGGDTHPVVRRCVFADGGDDGLDHSDATFTVEDTIFHDVNDKAMSMTDGFATVTNVLASGVGVTGLKGGLACTQCTSARNIPFRQSVAIQSSIIWPHSFASCTADMDYTITGLPADATCGTGNLSVDPQYRDAANCDFRPAVGSPALTAGPNGERIGWLGFPTGVFCTSSLECDDGNVCTDDVCGDARVCEHPEIAGCLPCVEAADCDDGNPCTEELCEASGTCSIVTLGDGAPCDDELSCTEDVCSGGVCVGTAACPGGWFCDPAMLCARSSPLSTSFQQGGSYAGTQDTWIGSDFPDALNGARDHVRWDTDAPATEYALVRFDAIFGPDLGQIPDGATIHSATLSLNLFNSSTGTPGEVHDVAVDWSEATTTWNSFGGEPGVQPDEIGPFAAAAPLAAGVTSVDVTASVARWSTDPGSSFGWLVVPQSTDQARAFSSEHATETNHPALAVSYFAPVPCLVDDECDDRLFCNGVEVCGGGFCRQALAPACPDDGIACTVDLCHESTRSCSHPGFAPGEVGGVSLAGASETTISWSATAGATRYDVATGALFDLRIGSGTDSAACLVDDATGVTQPDTRPAPAAGTGYYYFVRAQNDCGTGTYGYASNLDERLPDSCP
jgi:hypothetical protein